MGIGARLSCVLTKRSNQDRFAGISVLHQFQCGYLRVNSEKQVKRVSKNRPGRPSKGEHAKARVIGVRVNADEFDTLDRAASRGNKPVSAWVRDVALDAAKDEGEPK